MFLWGFKFAMVNNQIGEKKTHTKIFPQYSILISSSYEWVMYTNKAVRRYKFQNSCYYFASLSSFGCGADDYKFPPCT